MLRYPPLRHFAVVLPGLLTLAGPAIARGLSPLLAESFPVGTSGPACEAQGVRMGEGRSSPFDRRWEILCPEVERSVGSVAVVRTAPQSGILPGRAEEVDCGEASLSPVAGLAGTAVRTCRGRRSGLEYRSYAYAAKGRTYLASGLAGYDSALVLALRSVAADRVVPGQVAAASLGSGDVAALARARAAVADRDTLLGQGYRRNAAGAFAEAANLFAAAGADGAAPDGRSGDPAALRHELTVNRALQLSNLGEFEQAARIFAQAREMAGRDPVQARLSRNFEAIDAINRGDLAEAHAILSRPVPPLAPPLARTDGSVDIDRATAAGLSTASVGATATALGQDVRLTPAERAEIVDAQAQALDGTVLRLSGKQREALDALARADARVSAVRQGQVLSVGRLRAQIISEQAVASEQAGDFGAAEAALRRAEVLVRTQYPESASLNAARARLAGFLVRRGRMAEAATLYRAVVTETVGSRGALVGMSNLIEPWFNYLTGAGAGEQGAVADLFLASQLVERPGAADTLAQLSRELEGGSDEASALFRRSLAVQRDLERNRVQLARASALAEAGSGGQPEIAALAQEQDRLRQAQLQLFDSLSRYPQYRAVSHTFVTADEMRATLREGEGYLKLTRLGDHIYAVLLTPAGGHGWRLSKSAQEVAGLVATLRDSISVTVNGVRTTYPFDVDAALTLGQALAGPASAEIVALRHIAFEPDGAMLQLPLNLLVTDPAGVEAYHRRVDAGGDDYDFTGVAWLGRKTSVSTALSAASFRDARAAPASKAPKLYLGLGQNQPLGRVASPPSVRSASVATGGPEAGCDWPVSTWNQPIAATELREAASLFGSGRSDLMTGAGFNDSAVAARPDLATFRIVHFATHGLVTAPRTGCPVRPALLTSFGPGQSDGLLRFDEIFNLRLDADLVILSACDTAGGASLEATREAGIASGGGQALDGLVRAFIAAGGRQVIASHWPAPDDYNATERLFSGFLAEQGSEKVADALRRSQLALMDDPNTSHPFYWAGFALIGDGERPLHAR